MYPTYYEERSRDLAMQVCQSIERSSLLEFTSSRVDELLDVLHNIVHQLNQLPDQAFRELIQVILALRDVRNELRLARFLFDVEEVNPVHRYVMRSRAIVRGKTMLEKILQVWPLSPASR